MPIKSAFRIYRCTILAFGAVAVATGESETAPVVIDLSQDLVPQDTTDVLKESPGAKAVIEAATADPLIRTAMVLENGNIVAEYLRDDVDPTVPYQVWSVTKSWTSMLIGLAIQDGVLKVDDTLGDIFPDDTGAWVNVTDADFRKAVTIEQMLTMSSGLVQPPFDEMAADPVAAYQAVADGGFGGGGSLQSSMAFPEIGKQGEFSYLGISNIMSYVILQTTGMTPRQYLVDKVLPSLGIDDSEMSWWQNSEGIEYAYHGLEVTPHQMVCSLNRMGKSDVGTPLFLTSLFSDVFKFFFTTCRQNLGNFTSKVVKPLPITN